MYSPVLLDNVASRFFKMNYMQQALTMVKSVTVKSNRTWVRYPELHISIS